jgi:3-hydroxyacyl-[acyl-carrier-protein] dehydratase
MMLVPKEKILNYIPQRAPFVMVDNLINSSADVIETDFHILPNNLFLDNNVFSEYGLIENILQSSAAGLAVANRFGTNKPVNGFVGAISKLKIDVLPRTNDTLQTYITLLARLGDWYLASAATFVDGRKLIVCEIKIVGPGA